MSAVALAGCALGFSTGPGAADWQYTQWGMTIDQVRSASSGVAQPNPDRSLDVGGLKAALMAPYQGGPMSFTAMFLFDATGRLKVVTLNPAGAIACPMVVQELDANHGAPEARDDMGHAKTLRWDDVDNDNLIVYVDLGQGNCTIQYSPLPATRPDGKGL
jgi:hypothetical protein